MTKTEKEILEDFRAFIDFALSADTMPLEEVFDTLTHDIVGLGEENRLFLPRTSGYCKRCTICDEPINGTIQVHHHNEKCAKCGYEIIATQPHICESK